ncbi:MAG: 16S rRNA (guanine(966)-N(2))-methyltransferase RsmD [Spirochaetes bacterium]|nr:16S rRNA (guanine(966)-N(2))-methyltransferase RsmD [Spirochaetota bacterium]
MRIIAGTFKGRTIPFGNKVHGDADVTTDKVKEALFSILQDRIENSVFLDMFSCSGQIGYEALSRGAGSVFLNEFDFKRFNFIKEFIKNLGVNNYELSNREYRKLIPYLENAGYRFDLIFIDPPYEKISGPAEIYKNIIEELNCYSIYADDCVIVMQHYAKNNLPESFGNFSMVKTKSYGNNSLTFYVMDDITAR